MRTETKVKILKFLISAKQLSDEKKLTSMQELCNAHNVGKQLPTIMYQNGLFSKEMGIWQFNYDGEINMALAQKVGKMAQEYTKTKRLNRIAIKATTPSNINLDAINLKLDKILSALNIK